jgi:hypothetical protein
MTHGLFLVLGTRQYRGHRPGERFEARLDPALERGIARGNVQLLEMIDPSIREGESRLPEDWPPRAADAANTEAPKGASLVSEGGKK